MEKIPKIEKSRTNKAKELLKIKSINIISLKFNIIKYYFIIILTKTTKIYL